jgi:hypothetical protein
MTSVILRSCRSLSGALRSHSSTLIVHFVCVEGTCVVATLDDEDAVKFEEESGSVAGVAALRVLADLAAMVY